MLLKQKSGLKNFNMLEIVFKSETIKISMVKYLNSVNANCENLVFSE